MCRKTKIMQYVPVVSKTGKPLMPCHPARSRELVRKGLAVRRFNKGLFYIRLTVREDGDTQPIAIGVDPGSKREALTVKSAAHTFENVQTEAIGWVKDAVEQRRNMRRTRRARKTPYRQMRANRLVNTVRLPPSTRARWELKLRLIKWLASVYPVTDVVVEDIAAITKPGKRRWNKSFSPLEVGKRYFYGEVAKSFTLTTKQGWGTKNERDRLVLYKSKAKLSTRWDAHCVDSWTLANMVVGGHIAPDHTDMVLVVPLQFHRRQLHALQPAAGNIRRPYGSTRSEGFKRGTWVNHPKHKTCYVGGTMDGRISLHSIETGKRLCRNAKPKDVTTLCLSSWRLSRTKGVLRAATAVLNSSAS